MKMYKNILITGANSPYFESLLTLISTVHETSFEFVDQIFVYNFGLDESEINRLKSLQKVQVVEIQRTFEVFDKMRSIKTKSHFLKMFTLIDSQRFGENILWLDSGVCVLRSIKEIYDIIESDHIFLVGDVHLNKNYTHNRCSQIMNATEEELNDKQLSSGIFGFKNKGNYSQMIDDSWAYSQIEGCIDGFENNHRHDQSVLSILASRYNCKRNDIDIYGYWTDYNRNLDKANEINAVIFVHRRGYTNKNNLRYEN